MVRAVAPGARRLKSRFGAGLEPYTLIEMEFYEKEGRELVTLRRAEIRRSCFGLASDDRAHAALASLAENVIAFAPPHEPQEKLFRMVSACIEALSLESSAADAVSRYSEVWLLKLCGFLPDFRRCATCLEPLDAEKPVYLSLDNRSHCAGCGADRGRELPGHSYSLLRAIQRLSPLEFARATNAATGLGPGHELQRLTASIIDNVLERTQPRPARTDPPAATRAAGLRDGAGAK